MAISELRSEAQSDRERFAMDPVPTGERQQEQGSNLRAKPSRVSCTPELARFSAILGGKEFAPKGKQIVLHIRPLFRRDTKTILTKLPLFESVCIHL